MSDPPEAPDSWITVEYLGRIAILTINRPQKLGALTKDGFYLLTQRLREIDTHDEVFITILTGTGRFFSAGVDISTSNAIDPGTDIWRESLRETVSYTLNSTEAFYTHSKILVTALNGPVVGIAAALVSFSDFIFCAPHAYLLTPFTSLGLIAEGGASVGFVRRMGVSKATEALLTSRKILADDLVACGFVNKVFEDCAEGEDEKLRERVIAHVDDTLCPHLVGSSLLETKKLLMLSMKQQVDQSVVAELMGGLKRQALGIPQREFEKIRTGEKRHKL
ncbi:ClpP/crotonase-like domain-containing protein [Bipolaris maydis]|nr:ClpP/crotonase-like domain-containing protein [Bipolaris maydis]KAJ6277968.1 ClpP/crotonase-like domain-containing protein [Bipolaris maydis]